MSPTISINIPDELLNELDKLVEKRNYSSRSRAIQDAVTDLLSEFLYDYDPQEPMEGVIMVSRKTDLTVCQKLRELELNFTHTLHESIRHFHENTNFGLEILVTNGPFQDLISFVGQIKAINGVHSVRFSFIPLKEHSAIRDSTEE